MRSSFFGLEVSKRSIQISQKALDITGNNLSNVKTDGYTRQRVDTASLHMNTYNAWTTKNARLGSSGAGVTASGVSQTRDAYIDKRYRSMTCNVGEYDTKTSILSEVETALDNFENKGLSSAYTNLTAALSKYATDAADNEELASIVRNESYNLVTMLHTYATNLTNIENDNLYSLETSVGSVNQIVSELVNYNKSIVDQYSISGAEQIYNGESVNTAYGPNELLDKRNLLLDELSYYGNIQVEENLNGSVKVTFGDTVIVDDQKSETLMMKDYDNYNAAVLYFTNGNKLNISTGDIKAYTDLLNGNGPYASYYQNTQYGIQYYRTAINAFANGVADLMNRANGCDENNTERTLFSTSEDVYDADGNCTFRATVTAANIRISDEWMDSPTMIGEVYDSTTDAWKISTLDGNHANALLTSLENETVRFGDANDFNGTTYEYICFISDRLGQSIEYNQSAYDVATETANNLLDNRDAISGVSDTEEGINMITYKNWYNASSRLMTTLDDCLDKLINGTGRVGI